LVTAGPGLGSGTVGSAALAKQPTRPAAATRVVARVRRPDDDVDHHHDGCAAVDASGRRPAARQLASAV
jgi:hypothetical protein